MTRRQFINQVLENPDLNRRPPACEADAETTG